MDRRRIMMSGKKRFLNGVTSEGGNVIIDTDFKPIGFCGMKINARILGNVQIFAGTWILGAFGYAHYFSDAYSGWLAGFMQNGWLESHTEVAPSIRGAAIAPPIDVVADAHQGAQAVYNIGGNEYRQNVRYARLNINSNFNIIVNANIIVRNIGFYVGTMLVADFYPCEVNGEIKFYDIIRRKFAQQSGEGHLVEIE